MRAAGHEMPAGRVELLTHCRILGYVFNPVSFFYCYDRGRRADPRRRRGEQHLRGPPQLRAARWRTRPSTGARKKLMHVSPFFQPDAGTYRWELPPPGERVEAGDRPHPGRARPVSPRASRSTRRPLTDGALASALVRYPFMTLKVIGAIHFEALAPLAEGRSLLGPAAATTPSSPGEVPHDQRLPHRPRRRPPPPRRRCDASWDNGHLTLELPDGTAPDAWARGRARPALGSGSRTRPFFRRLPPRRRHGPGRVLHGRRVGGRRPRRPS